MSAEEEVEKTKAYTAEILDWLDREAGNAHQRANKKAFDGDSSASQWWRGNAAMARRVRLKLMGELPF